MEWYEIILIVCSAVAGVTLLVLDHRRANALDTLVGYYDARLARLEAVVSGEKLDSVLERLTRIETRIDYSAVKVTARRPDGKFAREE